MELIKILINVYEAKNEVDLFDSICYLQNFVEQNDNKEFLEEKFQKRMKILY